MKKIILIPVLSFLFISCRDRTLSEFSSAATIESAMKVAAAQQAEASAAVEAELKLKKSEKVVYRDRVVYRNSSSHSAQVEQKKGMSKRAKYAIIGGVGGAVVGGVATKSKKGAVIGGVVGAGTGYILGRKKDKRSGRLQ